MDDFTAKIHNKKLKLENSLLELNNEISVSFNFLQLLKNHSAEIVRDLNSVATPAIYFKGFVDVNSSILKYLSFLSEINCKFEMLGISQNSDINSVPTSDNTSSSKTLQDNDKLCLKLDSSLSAPDYQNNEADCEQSAESHCLFETVKPSNRPGNMCEVASSPKKNSSNDLQITKAEFINNGHSDSENLADPASKISSDDIKDNIELVTVNAKVHTSKNMSRKISDTEVSSSQRNYANVTVYNEVQQGRSHLPHADIPVAEVVPRKVFEYNCEIEIYEGIKTLQETSDGNLKKPSQRRVDGKQKEKNVIKPMQISRKVGDEYEITIEHIQSPSEFYVYIKDIQSNLFLNLLQNSKIICSIKNKMLDIKNENKKAWLSEQLGSYVLYFSKHDEIWCRAKVMNWCLNYKDNFIKIFLVDYGEYKCVSIYDLEAMPENLKKYPACVTRCHLYGIRPSDLDIDIETDSWGKESTEKMKSLTETSKKLKIIIAPEDDSHPKMSLPVLLNLADEDDKCVNELLVQSKCAVYISTPQINTETKDEVSIENEILKDWNPMKEDYEAYENSYDLKIDDPATYIYGYVGQDYEKVCKHFAKTGHCFKGQACKKEHKKLDPLGYTTDQEEVYKNAFNSLFLPPLDSVVRVQVTCLLGINNFCCTLDDRNLPKDEENLETLLKYMNQPENIKKMKKLLIPPSAGQIVIANYNLDGSWYRAKILESQPENDVYVVLFVDYGNKDTVSISQIRAIEARYLHLPFQAIRCFIFGIDQNPNTQLKDGMNYLNKRISNGQISIEIVSKLPGEDVSLLVHVFDESGKNIGEDLLEKNYAVFKKEMIISSESRTMPG